MDYRTFATENARQEFGRDHRTPSAQLRAEAAGYRAQARLLDELATNAHDPTQHAHWKAQARAMRGLAKQADEQRRDAASFRRINQILERHGREGSR